MSVFTTSYKYVNVELSGRSSTVVPKVEIPVDALVSPLV